MKSKSIKNSGEMKKFLIVLVGILFLCLISIIYRQHYTIYSYHFPIPDSLKKDTPEDAFYVFLVFTEKNCLPCLQEIVEILEHLPSQFLVAGVIPDEELSTKKKLRQLTGATFPFFSSREFRQYLPWHTPTLFGVSPSGKIIFAFPGIKGDTGYLKYKIISIYQRLSPHFPG